MIKVAIIDDHPVVREGEESILDREKGIKVVSEASDGKEFLRSIRYDVPDLAILDLEMPNEDGMGLLKHAKLKHPELSVLILSIHPAHRYAIRCLKAGASGYLNKSSTVDELVKAIRHIVNKKRKYISKSVARLLAENIEIEEEGSLHEKLSDREFTVLCMIANGDNVKTIADKLSLSPHTIHTYRSRIKEKMQLNSNVEVAHYAIKHDLI